MKSKIISIALIVCVLIIGISFFIQFQKDDGGNLANMEEITPQEEISEEQERKTIVMLYFRDKETGELSKEDRTIDVKTLANNPYEELMRLLIEGPQKESLERILPEGTKINSVNIKGDVVYVDLSQEFIDNQVEGGENESQTIYSIVNTLTELNEVNFVRILIDGQENLGFKDNCMNFQENFERND